MISYSNRWVGSRVLLGDGTGHFPTFVELPDQLYYAMHGIGSDDFNGDGYIDLIITNEAYHEDASPGSDRLLNPGTNLFLNDGNKTHPSFTMQNIEHESGWSTGFGVATGDVDNDNRFDFVVSRFGIYAGASILFKNVGVVNGVVNFVQSELPGAYKNGVKQHSGQAIDMADVNGDGYLDITIANFHDPNQLLLNNGSGEFDETGVYELPGAVAANAFGMEINTVDVKFGDVNGDLKPDLIFTNRNSEQKVLFINTLPVRFESHFCTPPLFVARY